jgi:hypothetical protein
MTWWTTVAGLTPLVAYDALRTSGVQLLDGVGSNHLSSTAPIQFFNWQYKGVAGNSNPLLMTSSVALPAAAVVAAFVRYTHVYTIWSFGAGGNTTMFNYASDSNFYFSAGSNWGTSGTAQPGLVPSQYVFLSIVKGATQFVLYVNGTQLGTAIANTYLPASLDLIGHVGNGNSYNLQPLDTLHAAGIWSGTATQAELRAMEAAARAELAGDTTGSYCGLNAPLGKLTLAPPQQLDRSGLKAHSLSAGLGAHNYYFTGPGQILGTVKNSPSTPVQRKVLLMDESSHLIVRSTWSHATTGAYAFTNIPMNRRYTVLSYDHTETYRAVIADRVLAELPV